MNKSHLIMGAVGLSSLLVVGAEALAVTVEGTVRAGNNDTTVVSGRPIEGKVATTLKIGLANTGGPSNARAISLCAGSAADIAVANCQTLLAKTNPPEFNEFAVIVETPSLAGQLLFVKGCACGGQATKFKVTIE